MNKFIIRKKRIEKINKKLKRLFPKIKIALKYKNPIELLIAVILSAQCTDKKVNEVTEKLFKKYKKLDDYATANQKEFEKDIKSTGFYRNKAKNIISSAKTIKEKFNEKVPDTMEELLTLPGVARKTANIVLASAYNIVEGIAVDTHVRRLALKFDLTENNDPIKIERDLMELLPKKEWKDFSNRMIAYGRKFCSAKKHSCAEHPLTKIFPDAANIWP